MKKAGIIFLVILIATTLIPLIATVQGSSTGNTNVSRDMVSIFEG